MTYTEEMTTSEILLRLASMRNELLQAVNDIEKISKNICYKAEQTELQTPYDDCKSCKWWFGYCHSNECDYTPIEDETRLTAKCLNCANGGSYKCSKCDGEMYFKDEPQTEEYEEPNYYDPALWE